MYLHALLLSFAYFVVSTLSNICPNGGKIYESGIEETTIPRLVNLHNDIRRKVAKGVIPGLPKATNMRDLVYDEALAALAKTISAKCEFKTSTLKDDRFGVLGQNLYALKSKVKLDEGGWQKAIDSWYKQHKMFNYPNFNSSCGAFTQMVWATTVVFGCDYVHFYNPDAKEYPFIKMYNCLYGPSGSIEGRLPYLIEEEHEL